MNRGSEREREVAREEEGRERDEGMSKREQRERGGEKTKKIREREIETARERDSWPKRKETLRKFQNKSIYIYIIIIIT